MGTFRYPIEIGDPQGQRYERVEALVDTGASYTVVPAPLLRWLGVEPSERRPFRLADDRIVERDTGLTQVRINGRTMPTVVVFAEEGSEALLGAYTLEGFGLAVDPLGRRLVPVPGLLMTARGKGPAHADQACLPAGRRMSNGGPMMRSRAKLSGVQ